MARVWRGKSVTFPTFNTQSLSDRFLIHFRHQYSFSEHLGSSLNCFLSGEKWPEKVSHLTLHTVESLFLYLVPATSNKIFRSPANMTWWCVGLTAPSWPRLCSATCVMFKGTDLALLWSLKFILKNVLWLLLALWVLRGLLSNCIRAQVDDKIHMQGTIKKNSNPQRAEAQQSKD